VVLLCQRGANPMVKYKGFTALAGVMIHKHRMTIRMLFKFSDLTVGHPLRLAIKHNVFEPRMLDYFSEAPMEANACLIHALFVDSKVVFQAFSRFKFTAVDPFNLLRIFVSNHAELIVMVMHGRVCMESMRLFSERRLNIVKMIVFRDLLNMHFTPLKMLMTDFNTIYQFENFVYCVNCMAWIRDHYEDCAHLYALERVLPDDCIDRVREYVCQDWVRQLFF
jgi:hypothetical protein